MLILIILFAALGANLIFTNKLIDQRVEYRIVNDFNAAYNMTENFMNMMSEISKTWAKEIILNHFPADIINKKNTAELTALLNSEKNKLSADTIVLINKEGVVLAQSGSDYEVGDSLEYKDIVRQTLKTGHQVTKIARENDKFVTYSSYVLKKDNDIKAVLLLGYCINDAFVENIKKNTSLEIAFIGNSAIMSSTKWGTEKNLDVMPISYLDYQNILAKPEVIKEIRYKGKVYIVNARKIKNMESLVTGSILFGYSYDKMKHDKLELFEKKLIIFYVTLFLTLGLIYLVVKRYLNAINKLTQAMNNVSNNNTYETITINTEDEIALLADSFNRMGTELNSLHTGMEKEIQNKTEALQDLNENLQELVVREATKNRLKEQQLVHQSRLAQMGEMISMIAHQWRQPLSAISSTSAAIHLKAQLNKLDRKTTLELSDNISDYSQHLSSTINDFRDFFKSNKEKKKTSYTEIVNSVLNIIEVSIRNKNITLIKELNCDLVFNSYENELKQVLLNLIKNAEDVLLEKEIKNPKIIIETSNGQLLVSDNAGGIPDDVMDRIFEPYFSTKMEKDGTGLGLYMSKIIIEEKCGGSLSAANNKQGAVFIIEGIAGS